MGVNYPSMRSSDLLRILAHLGYIEDRRVGSHRRLKANGRPDLTFAFHDGQTVPPGLVRKILAKDVGLSEDEIREILK
ncbi:type II toxin-antitoxin system HicA family toxin [Bifidobacterium thermacidophilum]|jgi:predicted RNA binding protein YcfA (HicA-like mRNA interferase family)|uniref:YcfA-like protein n=2 Tax=Bifidobacterium thermacidophilum TaxID=246618 RepID=A0A087E4H7_9BIFI|nr:type II toxin-antitoxin system HicA family toxin [Bifidobacterium thermacidophilum]KFJ02678.1 YcfA-like protein [Bifidobacterium thermacidophilum subsp. thermacidophilum]